MLSTLVEFLSKPSPQKDTVNAVIAIVFFLSIFLDISKIPVNPWKWILRTISRIFNADVIDKQKEITKDLDSMRASVHDEIVQSREMAREEMNSLRTDFGRNHSDVLHDLRSIKAEQDLIKADQLLGQKKAVRRSILKFADECRRGENHSEERFNEVLADIDEYTRLCNKTKDPNSVAEEAINFIRDVYRKRLEKNDFLV